MGWNQSYKGNMTVEYITRTSERWRRRGRVVEVGLSPVMQKELGAARFVQLPAIGTLARAGEHLGVVEGTLTAAEFYAPCAGRVVWAARPDASTSDWLVGIDPGREDQEFDKDCQSVG